MALNALLTESSFHSVQWTIWLFRSPSNLLLMSHCCALEYLPSECIDIYFWWTNGSDNKGFVKRKDVVVMTRYAKKERERERDWVRGGKGERESVCVWEGERVSEIISVVKKKFFGNFRIDKKTKIIRTYGFLSYRRPSFPDFRNDRDREYHDRGDKKPVKLRLDRPIPGWPDLEDREDRVKETKSSNKP